MWINKATQIAWLGLCKKNKKEKRTTGTLQQSINGTEVPLWNKELDHFSSAVVTPPFLVTVILK